MSLAAGVRTACALHHDSGFSQANCAKIKYYGSVCTIYIYTYDWPYRLKTLQAVCSIYEIVYLQVRSKGP